MTSLQFCFSFCGATGVTSLKFCFSFCGGTGVTSLKLFQLPWSDWADLAQILF